MADTPLIAAGTNALQCVIVTPEKSVLDARADFVALPMIDGELGVAPGRAPLIGRLGIGELRVRHGAETKKYFIEGGFAQVRANVVTVLTPRAVLASELKIDDAQHALDAAKATRVSNPLEQLAKEKAQARARAQIRILGKSTAAGGHELHT